MADRTGLGGGRMRADPRAGVLGRARAAARWLGAALVAAGLVVGGYLGYLVYGTGASAAHAQAQLRRGFARQLSAPVPAGRSAKPPALRLGTGLALLRIPRLGAGYRQVVVQGVAAADLARGPGHLPGTALPGQVGNVVISGHRTTYGAPFRGLAALRPGDPVALETAAGWWVYRVLGSTVVDPHDLAVADPVPGRPGARPVLALLTLTTCTPEYSAAERLVVRARLAGRLPRTAADPGPATLVRVAATAGWAEGAG